MFVIFIISSVCVCVCVCFFSLIVPQPYLVQMYSFLVSVLFAVKS